MNQMVDGTKQSDIVKDIQQDKIDYTYQQKEAMNHDNGHLRIIACAGSGKTEVISRRVAKLIQKGVKPKEIVAFTFTEKAADELKSRVRGILDEECPSKSDFGDMYVGTIHSFCFHMLQELIPKSLRIKLYEALLESLAAEHGARMTAMHKATDNASEMIKELQLNYNKARQASITNEILEIVGGAEALRK